MNKVSEAGMGGNGPQHTLVMRGASPAKRPSRASLEAHHSQARRSLRTLRPRFFLSAAAPDALLPAVPFDADVMEIIDKCGVRGLAPAVAAVENTNKVDQQTLRSIGLGSPKGIIFFDLSAATEKRDWVLEYAKELLAKDKQAFDKIGRDRGFKSGTDKILCVYWILPDVVAADRLPDAKASNKISRAAAASRPRRSRRLAKATLSMARTAWSARRAATMRARPAST